VRFDQRTENLEAPDHRHQVDAENPIPACISPVTIDAAAAHARIVDQYVDSAIPRDGRVRSRLKFAFERDVGFHTIDIGVGRCLEVRDRFFQRLFLDIAEHDLHPRL
jgi:hypothetical protein